MTATPHRPMLRPTGRPRAEAPATWLRAVAALALLAAASLAAPATAQDQRRPLLVEGKTTVFERVLAKDDAALHDGPGGAETGSITPFQPLYVYARDQSGWLEVGRGLLTGPEGWMLADDTVTWKQNIVVTFANPAARQRQLMFDKKESLLGIVEHESAAGMARRLRTQVISEGEADSVVTIEPPLEVSLSDNFYLLPILDWEAYLHEPTWNENMRLLKLASLPLRDEEEQEVEDQKMPTGVVFVIDTSTSMEPYIDETRRAVQSIVERIQNAEGGEYVRFGAVGFRDSVEVARDQSPPRDIEYRTRTFLRLAPDQSPDEIRRQLGQMVQATESTVGFDEDSVAGVLEAMEMPEWQTAGIDGGPIKLRYIVLITDAGPKHINAAGNQHRLLPDAVARRLAPDQKRMILEVIHVKTPDGAFNHAVAESAYREMSRVGSGNEAYREVDLTASTVDPRAAFRPVIEEVANGIAGRYRAELEELQTQAAEGTNSAVDEASLAMRLAWLGEEANTQAPDVIEAWTLDYSLEDPVQPALDVRLLVTKNELATMRDVLRQIVVAGQETRQGGDFFDMLRSAMARMAVDGQQVVNQDFETLDQAVGEFLADLPYRSQIMGITPDQWASMGGMRTTILDRVTSSIEQFEYYHDNPTLWTELYEGQDPGETVFAMPIADLP